MNKIIILLGVSILCASCAPTNQNPPVPTPAITPVILAPAPKPGVVDMPDIHPVTSPPVLTVVNYPQVAPHQKSSPSIAVYPGSLKENIERIAKQYGWRQLIWDAPEDYRWVGKARIHGENLQQILTQLLADYPLQAVFYQGNHVLYIHTRTLK